MIKSKKIVFLILTGLVILAGWFFYLRLIPEWPAQLFSTIVGADATVYSHRFSFRKAAEIRIGMSESQVRDILGVPLVTYRDKCDGEGATMTIPNGVSGQLVYGTKTATKGCTKGSVVSSDLEFTLQGDPVAKNYRIFSVSIDSTGKVDGINNSYWFD